MTADRTPNQNRESRTTLRVCGIDPGTRLCGYGIVDHGAGRVRGVPAIVEAGVIQLDDKRPVADRLVELEREVDQLLADHSVDHLAVEELYAHYKHPRTAIVMAHARGVVLLAARRRQIPVAELSANRIKQSLTGHGHASKEQMQHAVQSLWKLKTLPDPPDVADALAVALCFCREEEGRRR